MPRLLIVVSLALALVACGASPDAVSTAVAQTQAAEHAQLTADAQTATAGAPTATLVPSDTPVPTATDTEVPSATPTDTEVPTATATAVPSDTPAPTNTATPAATSTKAPPANTPVPPTATQPPYIDFVLTAKLVRAQVISIGGQIDNALQVGYIDCVQLVNSYEYVVNRRELNVDPGLAGPYAIYQSGIDKFIDRVHDIYGNCASFLADPSHTGSIPQQQWGTARLGVNESSDLLAQSITAAGGTP